MWFNYCISSLGAAISCSLVSFFKWSYTVLTQVFQRREQQENQSIYTSKKSTHIMHQIPHQFGFEGPGLWISSITLVQQRYSWKWLSNCGKSTQFVVHVCYYECRYVAEQCDTVHMTNWFLVCALTCAAPSMHCYVDWPETPQFNRTLELCYVMFSVQRIKRLSFEFDGQVRNKKKKKINLWGWECFSKAQFIKWYQMNMAVPTTGIKYYFYQITCFLKHF